MKIVMLGWELPPHNSGGLGVACLHMAKALASAGSEIDFILPYSGDHSQIDFMSIHAATSYGPREHAGTGAYDTPPVADGVQRRPSDPLTSIRDIQNQYVDYVTSTIIARRPDAIHAHDWLTMEAGVRAKELTGAPLIVHVHATEYDRAGGRSGNPLVHEVEEQGLLAADQIIAVSQLTKELIIQKYAIPSSKITVVHNAFDTGSLQPHVYDENTYAYLTHLQSEGYTVAATVTRFTVQKGLTHFMKAAARACERYDKLVFLFAGDGEQRDELIALSAAYGIADKVFFTGFVRGQQWRDAYSVADIFVMSSVSEPFGLTALEAAHHNAAVILSRQSGVGEVLSHVLRYDYWDSDRLADQLIAVATSQGLRRTLIDNVRTEYARLSWDEVAKQCLRLYKNATGAVL